MRADPRLSTHTGRICNNMNANHTWTVLAMAQSRWPGASRASLTRVTEMGCELVAARGEERRTVEIVFDAPARDMMEARQRLAALHLTLYKPTCHPGVAAVACLVLAQLALVLAFPGAGTLAPLRAAALSYAGSDANLWRLAYAVLAWRAALHAATFHFTYNVLRLGVDRHLGWQIATAFFGEGTFKKLRELVYAEDLLGEAPLRCA